MIQEKVKPEELDKEWMQLILEALELGIDKNDIREFFSNNRNKEEAFTKVIDNQYVLE